MSISMTSHCPEPPFKGGELRSGRKVMRTSSSLYISPYISLEWKEAQKLWQRKIWGWGDPSGWSSWLWEGKNSWYKLGQLLISNFYFFFYPDVVHTTNVEGKLYKEIYSNGSRWMSTGWSCLWTARRTVRSTSLPRHLSTQLILPTMWLRELTRQ